MLARLVAIFPCIALLTAAVPSLAAEETLTARIDAYARPFAEAGHLAGNLLVATADEVLYERSFGMADYELEVANGPHSRHCVASITKPMTVIVLTRLIEAGALAYEDPLSKWIPGFPNGERITVQHLREHTAGIPHRLADDELQVRPRSAADMAELAAGADLLFEPGTDEAYSSGGFSVLARVLELAGGKSYPELLAEHVLRPAGMTDTAHADSRMLLPGRTASYSFGADGGLVNMPPRDLSYLIGAGSVYSTARDLLAMMRTLLAGGYGELAQRHLHRSENMRWNGVTHGFRAFADYYADYDAGGGLFVIFTGNVQSGAGDRLRRDLPRLAAGEEVAVPEVPVAAAVAVPAEILRRYEGDYELRPGSPITLTVEGGAMRANEWTLIPTSETTFFSPQDYGRVTVVLDERGEAVRLDWEIGGEVYPMPRSGAD